MPPSVEQKGRLLKLQCYKAENLPVMDEALVGQGGADPYIKVDFGGSLVFFTKHEEHAMHLKLVRALVGMVTSTKKQRKKGLNPEFLQELQVPVMEPTMSSRVCFQLWDYDKAGLTFFFDPEVFMSTILIPRNLLSGSDDLIGTLFLNYTDISKSGLRPRWYGTLMMSALNFHDVTYEAFHCKA